MKTINKFFKIILISTFCAIFSTSLYGGEKKTSIPDKLPEVNLNLDKITAARIAEAVFVKLYGEEVLEQRPWIVSENDKIFFIKGTMRYSLGGVASIVVDKKNGGVLMYHHSK